MADFFLFGESEQGVLALPLDLVVDHLTLQITMEMGWLVNIGEIPLPQPKEQNPLWRWHFAAPGKGPP